MNKPGEILVNGQKAIHINGRVLKTFERSKYVDCDGDMVWLPSTAVRDNGDGTIDIQEWSYNLKFPNGQ